MSNLVIVLVGMMVLLSSNSPVRQAWQAWQEQRDVRAAFDAHRSELSTRALAQRQDTAGSLLVEFLDYQCPHCRAAFALHGSHRPGVRRAVVHYPIARLHPFADQAARAAVCAEMHGIFSAVHRTLLNTEEWMRDGGALGVLVEESGLSPKEAQECLDSQRVADRLKSDRDLIVLFGITGTPAYVGARGIERGVTSSDRLRELAGTR